VSGALTEEQRAILETRGVLDPEQLERLASKTRRAMGASRGATAACHSDVADDDTAREIQSTRLDPVTLEPLEAPPAP